MKLLLLNNADLTVDKEPILYTALIYYEYQIVKLLLDAGADVNYADKKGKKPLYYAINISKKNEIIKLLVDEGAME